MRTWLCSRRLPFILACIGMLLTLPSLWTGLVVDDFFHREILVEGAKWPVEDASLFGLFSFLSGNPEQTHRMMEVGLLPWWTFEGVRATFWRPLTELTHWLDYRLWPHVPLLMHLQNLLWFGIAIWIISKLYRKIMATGWVAGLAALLFAIDNAHGVAVGWIANRNALIAVFFGGLTLLVHHRWRRAGWRPGMVLGPLFFAIGLLAGEAALAIGAYLCSYALFLDHGSIRRKFEGFLPYAVIAFGWCVAYRALGFGTWGTGAYLDPGQQSLPFLKALITRIPILLLGQFGEPPADLYDILPEVGGLLMWIGAVGFVLLVGVVIYPLLKREAVARFWTVGMLLALIPVCATFPSNRLLFFVGIGGMGVLAQLLAAWFDQAAWLAARGLRRTVTRGLVVVFVGFHLILAPLTLPISSVQFWLLNTFLVEQPARHMPYSAGIEDQTAVLINPPLAFFGIYLYMYRTTHGEPVPANMWCLASGVLPLTLTRIDERSLELTIQDGFLQVVLDQVFRGADQPMQVGQRVEFSRMTVNVLELADNWQPSRARFTFDVTLDDPSLLFLRWQNDRFVPYPPPVVGASESFPAYVPF